MATKKTSNKTTVAVIGLGYVGLPLALLADSKGYSVIGVDRDAAKVDLINKKAVPYKDKELGEQLKKSKLVATTDFSQISNASIIVISVPTPVYEDNTPNLEPLTDACKSIAENLEKDQLIVLESTVNPGISENVVLPILTQNTKLRPEKDFYLAHCPERINPGDSKWNIKNINRVVGALSQAGLDRAVLFYESIIDGDVKPMMSIKEAEAVKIVENAFRDINIAFVNELAMSFSRMNIDITNVLEGASTKPFSFLAHFPGCGVGGHCIPVDPHYLIEYARKNGFNHNFLSLARKINSQMPEFTVDQLMASLREKDIPIDGTKVAVLGLAYKPEIDDYRESPSFELIKHLEKNGLVVASFDPFIPSKSTASSLDSALENAKAVIVATAHKSFKKLSPDYFLQKDIRILIDGRNCLPKHEFRAAGITYKGIGR